ncbi:MAG TPA: TauD/TfdA family dioxygenase, partial [Reyranella sp.]|nr:TauD/TfdA family dioxygenase [Reyranella sp.]
MTFELPPEQTGPAAWYGPEMARRTDWAMPLTEAEIAEVETATKALASREADIAAIKASDFPLPTLGPKLQIRVDNEVLNGRGFLLLRGLPVERWTMREAATAFFGLGAHLGSARSQNGKGHVLGHVQDIGLASNDPNVRIYQTHERQTFHTDSCDIVGLLCLKTAQSGGLSALVSSTTIFNEMRRRRPDLLKHLFEPLATDRRGEVPPGARPYFEIPVFNWHAAHL